MVLRKIGCRVQVGPTLTIIELTCKMCVDIAFDSAERALISHLALYIINRIHNAKMWRGSTKRHRIKPAYF